MVYTKTINDSMIINFDYVYQYTRQDYNIQNVQQYLIGFIWSKLG